MKVEQIYTGCLAQGAYYIESNGEAAIIDPLREVAPYILKAEEQTTSSNQVHSTMHVLDKILENDYIQSSCSGNL